MIRHGPCVVAEPGGAMRLREVVAVDAERLFRWRTEPSARAMFRDDRDFAFEDHLGFLARYLRADCGDRWFIIEDGREPIGAIALYAFSADGTEAEWGRFVIAPECRGRGRARRALALLLAHARDLGVRTLRCEVAVGNERAEALYRSLGFACEGFEESDGRRFSRLVAALDPPG